MSGFEEFALATAIAGSVLGAAKTISAGSGAARQAAAQATFLQSQAEQQRQMAAAQEAQLRRRQAREQARMRALLADRGIDIASGSALLGQEQAAADAEFQALMQRSSAGAQLFAAQHGAAMARSKASQARSGLLFDAGLSLVNSAEKIADRGHKAGLFWPKKSGA